MESEGKMLRRPNPGNKIKHICIPDFQIILIAKSIVSLHQ